MVANTNVHTASVPGATLLHYVPYVHSQVPVWNGTQLISTTFPGGSLSQFLSDATKSPAAAAADRNYDVFYWLDGVTARISRGPQWLDATTRGTGLNSSELTRVQGLLVNANAITNGPAVNRGTYLGTIRTNGTSTVDWIFGQPALTGTPGRFMVWNMYNRINVHSMSAITQASWVDSSQNTWRGIQNTSNVALAYLTGLQEDSFEAKYQVHARTQGDLSGGPLVGIGLDATTVPIVGSATGHMTSNAGGQINCDVNAFAAVQTFGFHTIIALENAIGASITYIGTTSGAQSGIMVTGRM